MAVFELVVEGRPPPVRRGHRRSLVEPYSKLSLSLVSVSVQRKPRPSNTGCSVSMKTSPRDSSTPRSAAALAEAADQVVFGQTRQALADQPVHQAQAGREFHALIMPRNRDGRKARGFLQEYAGTT